MPHNPALIKDNQYLTKQKKHIHVHTRQIFNAKKRRKSSFYKNPLLKLLPTRETYMNSKLPCIWNKTFRQTVISFPIIF